MTHIDTLPEARTGSSRVADRRVLVVLAVIYLLGFATMMVTSADREPDADPVKLIASWDTSLGTTRIQSYALMALCALLVFLGAGIRSRLIATERRWTSDVAFTGFGLLAMTFTGFGVSALALQHAVDIGDPTLVAGSNLLDTSNFLPAMASMACIYIGTGVSALAAGSLPRWLCWASIVLGVLSPAGPGAFLPFMLLPVWLVVVASMLRGPGEDGELR